MRHYRKILLLIVVFFISNAFSTPATAQTNKDSTTLKALDFRGQGYDVSIDYALLNSRKIFAVIVDVQTRGTDSLIKIIGKIMKELDAQGLRNMVLLASDKDTSSVSIRESIYIYSMGEVFGVLSKGLSDDDVILWFYHNEDRKIVLQEYPKNFNAASYIKTKIKEAIVLPAGLFHGN